MTTNVKVLAFAGSTRSGSYNKKLVAIAAQGAREAGAETTVIDLRDYPLPIFDEDLERAEGLPANGAKLKTLFKEHDGFLISSPEYNSSVTAVLKNAIDWVSRAAPDEPALAGFRGKAAVLMSASPGALGGLRGLVHLRSILGNIGVIVLPDQVAVPRAMNAFKADGTLEDEKQHASIFGLGGTLAQFLARHKGEK